MPTPDPPKLVARLIEDALGDTLDDAAFRRRTLRAARQLQRALAQPAAPARANGTAARSRKAAPASPPPYRYITVPNGAGGTTNVSVQAATFEALAQALGGAAKVAEHARKVVIGHKADSGVSRSAYVVRRLQQRAARATKP